MTMNVTLSLQLNAEQTSALQKRADSVEPHALSIEAYLTRSLNAEIASYVEADFNAAAQRLIDAAKTLPFDERTALIAEVEQKIQTIS